MRIHGILATAAAAALSLAASADIARAQSAATFDAIEARSHINCGVNTGLAGFGAPDSQGVWRGLDVDLCRAVAAAMFGDATKVRFVPTTAQQRFTALQSGEVDMLSRNSTWTLSRDSSLGLDFVGIASSAA
jgi:general L-amino acid transport system substrate-binding protein